MRPLALPAVGGLCSAVFLFSTLVPMFKSAFALSGSGDIPTMLSTEPMLKCTGPIAFTDGDAVVDLQLDDQGRIVDFTIVSAPGQQNETLRRSIQNSLSVHRVLASHDVRPRRSQHGSYFLPQWPQQPHRCSRIAGRQRENTAC